MIYQRVNDKQYFLLNLNILDCWPHALVLILLAMLWLQIDIFTVVYWAVKTRAERFRTRWIEIVVAHKEKCDSHINRQATFYKKLRLSSLLLQASELQSRVEFVDCCIYIHQKVERESVGRHFFSWLPYLAWRQCLTSLYLKIYPQSNVRLPVK